MGKRFRRLLSGYFVYADRQSMPSKKVDMAVTTLKW